MTLFSRRVITRILFVLLALFTSYILFYRLGVAPLDNWDEAWYGDITKNMLSSGDYLMPHWNNAVLIDKAPLYMWTSAAISKVIGLSEFSLRLASAISGLAIILLVLRYTYGKYGMIPALVAYASIALNNLFVYRTRSGNLDALTTLLVFVSYFVMISRHRYRLPVLGILFAVIYLSRTSFVVFPLTAFVLHDILFMRKKIIRNLRHYALFLVSFVLLAGWWVYYGYLKEGMPFIDYYIFNSEQSTITGAALEHLKPDYLAYTYYALQRRLFFLFIAGLVLLVPKLNRREYFVQVYFAVALIILLSFSQKMDNWYLMPSTPFWALVIGYAAYKIMVIFKRFMIVPILMVLAVSFISFRTFTQNIIPILHTISAAGEAESGKYLRQNTQEDDIIVRLDHLYPTLVYYSDRRVLASPIGSGSGKHYISRKDLPEMIAEKKIRWASGQKKVVDEFLAAHPEIQYERITINHDEFILKFL